MSKKRQSRKSTRRRSEGQAVAEATQHANGSGRSAFNPDYSQTIKDLKRIGILASSFFVVLVVLSLFLR